MDGCVRVRGCRWLKSWRCCSLVLRAARLLLAPAGGLVCVWGLGLRAARLLWALAVHGMGVQKWKGRVCVCVKYVCSSMSDQKDINVEPSRASSRPVTSPVLTRSPSNATQGAIAQSRARREP